MIIISGEQTGRREGKNEIDGTAPNIYPSQSTKCYVQFVNDLMWFIYRDSLTRFQIKSRLFFNHWNVLRLRRFLVSYFSSSQLSYEFFFYQTSQPSGQIILKNCKHHIFNQTGMKNWSNYSSFAKGSKPASFYFSLFPKLETFESRTRRYRW